MADNDNLNEEAGQTNRNTGALTTNVIKPVFKDDKYPVADINYLKGGLHVAAFEDDLFVLTDDNKLLSTSRLKIGMEVYCIDTGRKFRLIGGTYSCNREECGCTLTQGICNEEFTGCKGLSITNPEWKEVFELFYLANTSNKKTKTLYEVESSDKGDIVVNKRFVEQFVFNHKHDGIQARKISFFELNDINMINAFTLNGKKSSYFAPFDHAHSQYALVGHTHPDWLDIEYVKNWAMETFAYKNNGVLNIDWINEIDEINSKILSIQASVTNIRENSLKLMPDNVERSYAIDRTITKTGISEYAARADHAHDYLSREKGISILNIINEHLENHISINKDELIGLAYPSLISHYRDYFEDTVEEGDYEKAARHGHTHSKLAWIEKIIFGEENDEEFKFWANLVGENGEVNGKKIYSLYALTQMFGEVSEENINAHASNPDLHFDLNITDLNAGKITKNYLIEIIKNISNVSLVESGGDNGSSNYAARSDHKHDSKYLDISYKTRIETLESNVSNLGGGGGGSTLATPSVIVSYDSPSLLYNYYISRKLKDSVITGISPLAARADHYHKKLDYIELILMGEGDGTFTVKEELTNNEEEFYSLRKIKSLIESYESIFVLSGVSEIEYETNEDLDAINHEKRIKQLEAKVQALEEFASRVVEALNSLNVQINNN